MREEVEKYQFEYYSTRAITKPLKQIPENLASDEAVQRETAKLLWNQVTIINNLMKSIDNLIEEIKVTISACRRRNENDPVIPDNVKVSLIKAIDCIMVTDILQFKKKEIYSCIMYCKKIDDEILKEVGGEKYKRVLQREYDLSVKSYYFIHLYKEQTQFLTPRDLYIDCLKYCINMVVDQISLFPKDHFMYLRSITTFLFIIDTYGSELDNPFKQKSIDLDKMSKLIRTYPFIPIFGDIYMSVYDILYMCPNFDRNNKSYIIKEDRTIKRYLLSERLPEINTEFDSFITKLTYLLPQLQSNSANGKIDIQMQTLDLAIQGFRLLSKCNMSLKLQYIWKLAHPCPLFPCCICRRYLPMAKFEQSQQQLLSQNKFARCSDCMKSSNASAKETSIVIEESRHYASSLQYNIDKEEKKQLLNTCVLIKNIASELKKVEATVSSIIRKEIYRRIQYFVKDELLYWLHHVDKAGRKKTLWLMDILIKFSECLGDWYNNKYPDPDSDYRLKSKDRGLIHYEYLPRAVAPSVSQLLLYSSLLSSIIDDQSPAIPKQSLFGKSIFTTQDIDKIKTCYLSVFTYMPLLNWNQTINDLSNIGEFWFREIYLDSLTIPQFPYTLSFPYLLLHNISAKPLDHILEDIHIIASMYNDSGMILLNDMKCQYLYKELEMETNLVMDDLIERIAKSLYSYCKSLGATELIPYEKIAPEDIPKLYKAENRLSMSFIHSHLDVLGHSINIYELLRDKMNSILRKDMNAIFEDFKAISICEICNTNTLIKLVRNTHRYVQRYVDVDSFDTIYNEVFHNASPLSFKTSLSDYICSQLKSIMIDYIFYADNQFFITLKADQGKHGEYDKILKYGSSTISKYLNNSTQSLYFCQDHMNMLVSILTQNQLIYILCEITSFLINHCKQINSLYREAISSVLPESIDKCDFATLYQILHESCSNIDKRKLRDISASFKVIGNGYQLLSMIQKALTQSGIHIWNELAPFLTMSNSSVSNMESLLKSIYNEKYKTASLPLIIASTATNLKKSVDLYAYESNNITILNPIFDFIYETISKELPDWIDNEPSNGYLDGSVQSKEFWRIWDIYLFCYTDISLSESLSQDNQMVYGSGILYGGITLLSIMRQYNRFKLYAYSAQIENDGFNQSNNYNISDSLIGCLSHLSQSFGAMLNYRSSYYMLNAYQPCQSAKIYEHPFNEKATYIVTKPLYKDKEFAPEDILFYKSSFTSKYTLRPILKYYKTTMENVSLESISLSTYQSFSSSSSSLQKSSSVASTSSTEPEKPKPASSAPKENPYASDPQYAKYFRLVKMGMSIEHCQLKMRSEGVDEKVIASLSAGSGSAAPEQPTTATYSPK